MPVSLKHSSFFIIISYIPLLVCPAFFGWDKIGLKDYEQLECTPLLKNDVNAEPFLRVTSESVYEGICEYRFLCAKHKKKKRQYECFSVH